MSPARVGMVATVRGLDHSARTWLDHHLRQGVAKIYLVFDAPAEDRQTIDVLRAAYGDVLSCIEADEAHWARARELPDYAGFEPQLETVVVARQMLNVGVVLPEARREGMAWLLHLDADELIAPYTSNVEVAEYLGDVPAEIDEVIFPNFEAVPEGEDLDDPFREVTLFKKSPYYLRYKEFEHLFTAWDGAGGRFALFNAYITGKSALRLADVDAPFVPHSVHHFLPLRFAGNVHIEDQGGPAVFHYPHCGLARFVQRFTGMNLARTNTYGALNALYQEAAELVRDGREGELPDLYRRKVMLQEPGLMGRLQRRELLLRRNVLAE